MELKTNKGDLLKVLTTAIKAVPNKTPLPILENFLLDGDGENLTVIASDQQITVTAKCKAIGGGKACIPAKTFLDLVKTLPDVEITLSSDGNTLRVDWGNGNSTIPSFEIADFPETGAIPEVEAVSVPSEKLRSAILGCLPCTADDDLRPVLAGICFNGNGGKLEAVASDSHCLIISPMGVDSDLYFILHRAGASIIKDNLTEETTEIRATDKEVFVTNGSFTISVRKIEGKFPNYRSIIPTNNTNTLELDSPSFVSAIKRVSTCANKDNGVIKLTLSSLGGCEAQSQDLSFSLSAREAIGHCTYEGSDMSIGLKSPLLIQIIGAFKSDSVRMKFSSPNKAVLVESDEEDTKAIIMPVQIA